MVIAISTASVSRNTTSFQNRRTSKPSRCKRAVRKVSCRTCSKCWLPSSSTTRPASTSEVGEVRAYAMLASELPSEQTPVAQLPPQHPLGLGLFLTKAMLAFVVQSTSHVALSGGWRTAWRLRIARGIR